MDDTLFNTRQLILYLKTRGLRFLKKDEHLSVFIERPLIEHQFSNLETSNCEFSQRSTLLTTLDTFELSAKSKNILCKKGVETSEVLNKRGDVEETKCRE